jgi:uncharacterized protein YecT (DUF1311 family)
MRFGISALGLTTILFGGYGIVLNVQDPAKKITESEIKTFINSYSGVDECQSLNEIHINHLEYFDFIGDGQQEAVVIASTCMTGTAGPDIHAVYRRDAEGKIVELPFLDHHGDPPLPNGKGWRAWIFGNANYALTVESGKLMLRWGDTSHRENPVVAWYKWDGKKFVFDRMKVEGPFPTSYDCAKATLELDLAICYSPSVAALDVQLGQAYRAALQRLPEDKKQELQGQQRRWIARREKECGDIYKFWVECLTDLYTQRIAELQPEFPAHPASSNGTPSAAASNLPRNINWLKDLSDNETFLAAKLSAAERKEIIDQVEKTSFDVPDSWESELRVRRVSLGEAEGLILRGTKLLCGGTGNCETWVFRRSQGNWFNLFAQEAPVVSGVAFEQEATGGIKNLLVSANSSAARESRVLFRFDGKFYRQSECFDISLNGSTPEGVEKVPCK